MISTHPSIFFVNVTPEKLKKYERKKGGRGKGGKEGKKKNHTDTITQTHKRGRETSGGKRAQWQTQRVTYIRSMVIQLHVCLIGSVDGQDQRVLERVNLLHVVHGDISVSEENKKMTLGYGVCSQDRMSQFSLLESAPLPGGALVGQCVSNGAIDLSAQLHHTGVLLIQTSPLLEQLFLALLVDRCGLAAFVWDSPNI